MFKEMQILYKVLYRTPCITQAIVDQTERLAQIHAGVFTSCELHSIDISLSLLLVLFEPFSYKQKYKTALCSLMIWIKDLL